MRRRRDVSATTSTSRILRRRVGRDRIDAPRRGLVSRAFALVVVTTSAVVKAVRLGVERRAPRASGRGLRARLAVILARVSRASRFDATRARLAASTLAALETLQSLARHRQLACKPRRDRLPLARVPLLALVALELARLRPRQHALPALGEALQLEELTHQRLEIGAGRGAGTRRRQDAVASRLAPRREDDAIAVSGRARAPAPAASARMERKFPISIQHFVVV